MLLMASGRLFDLREIIRTIAHSNAGGELPNRLEVGGPILPNQARRHPCNRA